MSAEGGLRDRDAADFQLIETLRFEPEAGFARLERHLARLQISAAALGFAFDRHGAMAALEGIARPGGPLRVRLTLGRDGQTDAIAVPLPPDLGRPWRLAVATIRLSSADPLIAHKTTRRALYEAARAEFPPSKADEVILLNEDGAVCEGTITNIFVRPSGAAVLLTPHHACGLLPGVLRQELLDEGRAVEATLFPKDLVGGATVYVGNALRGLLSAGLVTEAA